MLPTRIESPMFDDPSVVAYFIVFHLRAIKFSEMSILLGSFRFIEIPL